MPRAGPGDPAYRWPIIDAPGIGDLKFINDRVAAETYLSAAAPEVAEFRAALYEREARVAYQARRCPAVSARHLASWNALEAGGSATGAQYDVSSRGR